MKQNVLSKYQNIRKMVKLEKQLAALVVTQENELLIETTSCDNDSKTQQMILKQKNELIDVNDPHNVKMKLQLENDFLTLMDEQSKIHQQKLDDLQKRQKDKMQGMLQRLESDDYQPVTDKKIRSHYHLPSLLKSPIPKKMSLSMSGPNSPMITPTHSKSDEDFNKFLDDRGSPIGSLASDDSFDDRKLSSSKKKKKHESITEEKSLSSSTPNALSLSKEDKKSKKSKHQSSNSSDEEKSSTHSTPSTPLFIREESNSSKERSNSFSEPKAKRKSSKAPPPELEAITTKSSRSGSLSNSDDKPRRKNSKAPVYIVVDDPEDGVDTGSPKSVSRKSSKDDPLQFEETSEETVKSSSSSKSSSKKKYKSSQLSIEGKGGEEED